MIAVIFLCASSICTSAECLFSCENEIVLHFNTEWTQHIYGRAEAIVSLGGIYVEIVGDLEFSSWHYRASHAHYRLSLSLTVTERECYF